MTADPQKKALKENEPVLLGIHLQIYIFHIGIIAGVKVFGIKIYLHLIPVRWYERLYNAKDQCNENQCRDTGRYNKESFCVFFFVGSCKKKTGNTVKYENAENGKYDVYKDIVFSFSYGGIGKVTDIYHKSSSCGFYGKKQNDQSRYYI